jgi:hypothetical protein
MVFIDGSAVGLLEGVLEDIVHLLSWLRVMREYRG